MWGFLLNSFLLNLTPSSTRPPEVNIDGENLHRFLNDSRSFNKSVWKNVTYDNIKSHKKTWIHRLSRRCIFEKTLGESN